MLTQSCTHSLSIYVLNETILNHVSSHKTGMPTQFHYQHGFQTSLSALTMGDSEAQKAII